MSIFKKKSKSRAHQVMLLDAWVDESSSKDDIDVKIVSENPYIIQVTLFCYGATFNWWLTEFHDGQVVVTKHDAHGDFKTTYKKVSLASDAIESDAVYAHSLVMRSASELIKELEELNT